MVREKEDGRGVYLTGPGVDTVAVLGREEWRSSYTEILRGEEGVWLRRERRPGESRMFVHRYRE